MKAISCFFAALIMLMSFESSVETDISAAHEIIRCARTVYIEDAVYYEGEITDNCPLYSEHLGNITPVSGSGYFVIDYDESWERFIVSFTATVDKSGKYAGEYNVTEGDYEVVPTEGGYSK